MNQLEPAHPFPIQNYSETHALAEVGQVANDYASRSVFADYLSRKAANTCGGQLTHPPRMFPVKSV